MTAASTYAPQSAASGPRRKFTAGYFILWILPFVAILLFIAHYSVDVLYWDEYEPDIAGLPVRVMAGHALTWTQLTTQHNENRLVFPRLLELAIAWLTAGDVRWEMVTSAVMVLIISAALLWIVLRTIKNRGAALAAALVVDWLLFTPAQWQDFLWGLLVSIFMPIAALAIIMVVLGSDLNIWVAGFIAATSAIISTYSLADGMIVWALAIPFFLIHPSRHRFIALAVWIILAGVNIGYYFHGYVKPGLEPPMSAVLQQPVLAAEFVLAFLGNALRAGDNIARDIEIGSVAVMIWFAGVFVVLIRRNRDVLVRALPWIIFGSYAIFSGTAAAAGRLGWGLGAANPVRYTTSALPLWVSLVPLWIVICQDDQAKEKRGWGIPWPIWLMTLGIAFLALFGADFIQGELGGWIGERRAARVVLQFSLVAPQADAIATLIYPDPPKALAMIDELSSAHLLHCGRVTSDRITDLPGGIGAGWGGTFEELYLNGNQILVSGWANDPGRKSPPDAILLTVPDSSGAQRVFAIVTNDRLPRPDVPAATHDRWLQNSGWQSSFSASLIPPGSTISAWAYDSYAEKAYGLDRTHKMPG